MFAYGWYRWRWFYILDLELIGKIRDTAVFGSFNFILSYRKARNLTIRGHGYPTYRTAIRRFDEGISKVGIIVSKFCDADSCTSSGRIFGYCWLGWGQFLILDLKLIRKLGGTTSLGGFYLILSYCKT